MMNSINHLVGSTIVASDGEIGRMKQAFFDDQAWAVRYLVVDTGSWLSEREVLISPYSVKQPLDAQKTIAVALTRQQVQGSPDIDTHQPVSRRHERQYLNYYAYPEYWDGGGLWAMDELPFVPPVVPPLDAEGAAALRRPMRESDVPAEDVHLRSTAAVTGHDIRATDDSIGHVHDFVFDDQSWAIRYLVVDTRNWWPGGKKVLVATRWIDRISWVDRTVFTLLTREQIKNSPEYVEAAPITREYEKKLHDAFKKRGYWD